jgi:hypothetical protein
MLINYVCLIRINLRDGSLNPFIRTIVLEDGDLGNISPEMPHIEK